MFSKLILILSVGSVLEMKFANAVECYFCSTEYGPSCNDPFRSSGRAIAKQSCDGACFKGHVSLPGQGKLFSKLFHPASYIICLPLHKHARTDRYLQFQITAQTFCLFEKFYLFIYLWMGVSTWSVNRVIFTSMTSSAYDIWILYRSKYNSDDFNDVWNDFLK